MAVEMKRFPMMIPTYEPAAPLDLPMFFEKKAYQGAEGRVYPIPYADRLSNQPVEKYWDAVVLRNEHIEVTLLPQIGGKIHGAKDLHNGYEFIYQNVVIKPAMVGLAGPWVSGGVEFNWPQHHRPTTFMPLEATLRENADGSKSCLMGEADPFNRMRAQVAITVYPGSSVVEAKATVYNRTDRPLPFMWWNNLAVRVHEKYKACFPPDVEWGNDHDRRAVISFPEMKGIYHTARPFDYGAGTDVTWFPAVKLPTSVMVSKGQSDMDFVGGYDFEADAGTVTVSDHRVSPGKKMWTWGDGPFGRAWSNNLTDNGDRYIELMTGAYTDNQPDFTWIMPGETRQFEQIWFPIRGIGEPKNANRNGALSFEIREGKIRVGAVTTLEIRNAWLTLSCKGEEILSINHPVSPEKYLLGEADLPEGARETDFILTLLDENGNELISYQPVEKGKREKLAARSIPPRPKDIESLEELYLHGAHLIQYKHHTYEPEAYFTESLNRDPMDYRCNLEMGKLLTERGDYEKAEFHLRNAVKRIKMRNDNPGDVESLYCLGRLMRLQGREKEAYGLFSDASWQYAWRSAALYEMACLDAKRGNYREAIRELEECLVTNGRHYGARLLLGYLSGDVEGIHRILEEVPQDAAARFALHFMEERVMEDYILDRPEDCLDAALQFEKAGLTEEAIHCLSACQKKNMLTMLHLARLRGEDADEGEMRYCFPNRLEDIPALDIENAKAQYLLGCLYYDRKNYEKAVFAWEKAHALDPCDAYTCRNLAQAYFDHMDAPQKAKAMLEKALELAPDNARILYELLQLYKNLLLSPEERIELLEKYGDLCKERDDCFLEKAILYTQVGRLEEAKELLLSKRFNIYEGGEGKLTRHHGWLYTLLGRRAQMEKKNGEALQYYRAALVFPENYGEGRHYSAQEANIYYYTGLLLREMGDEAAAKAAWEEAARQPAHLTEISYFAAKSLEMLNRDQEAKAIYSAMKESAEGQLENADLHGYFGVGMPSPLPFELNIRRQNTIPALLIKALAEKGLQQDREMAETLKQLRSLDPHGTPLKFFEMLDIL
ncbi:MAG: DUF5107 domain-containing protein [Clostridiales bacterium]|nr:DUF5107 domain-containing protein [Clostridiales bacterium]